jgi:hypothetical protein
MDRQRPAWIQLDNKEVGKPAPGKKQKTTSKKQAAVVPSTELAQLFGELESELQMLSKVIHDSPTLSHLAHHHQQST